MSYATIPQFISDSPAMRLLRSPNAGWILEFFQQNFKQQASIASTHSEIAANLSAFLAAHREATAACSNQEVDWDPGKVDSYLTQWCSPNVGWLKRFIDEAVEEPCYQLTPASELALNFVTSALQQSGFVGTESRLKSILRLLDEVAVGASCDRELTIAHLESQRAELDQQLAKLKSQHDSSAWQASATQVKERFQLALQQLTQLKSEFRAVEERFKEITRKVQQRVFASEESRGGIIEFALDSEDALQQGDQGRSFFEFMRLLHSPDSQDRIAALVEQLSALEVLSREHHDLESLRTMVPTLIAEAAKILKTTQHLSMTLRRLLDSRSTQHHRQLTQVLRDIVGEATARSENPPTAIGLEVEVELELNAPLERPFWSAAEPFDLVALSENVVEPGNQMRAMEQLVALERLDWQMLRNQISAQTTKGLPISLGELLKAYPVEQGVVEILGYLQIAHDDGHQIDHRNHEYLPLPPAGQGPRMLRLPRVVFLPPHQRASGICNEATDTAVADTISHREIFSE